MTGGEQIAADWKAVVEGLDIGLMVNTAGDDMFPPDAALALFDALPSGRKRMMLWEGGHVTEPAEMIDEIVLFINRHSSSTST